MLLGSWPFARKLVSRLTLVQRFALVSAGILVTGAFIIGSYVAAEIEDGVISRSSAIAALYVDSFVSPHLQGLNSGAITANDQRELDRLLRTSSLGQEIVSFKVWDRDGRIVYASDAALIGQEFGLRRGLEEALAGNVYAGISDLSEEENRLERLDWSRLLETYMPVRADRTGAIIGAAEFYQDPSELEAEIGSSQRRGWIIVGVSTAGMYLLLVGLVKGASKTLDSQRRRLERLAEENADLAQRVRKAAAQKSETDERLLMRIAQDLHDGPAQDLGLALLRIRSLRQGVETYPLNSPPESESVRQDFQLVETALASALKEVREISSGLHLPEIEGLTLAEVVEKAKLDHEQKTGCKVALDKEAVPPSASLPVKIAVYRILQEALNNSYRHAGVKEQQVHISSANGWLHLEVADQGVGFDPAKIEDSGSVLGLRGMRERIEMLGGTLEVATKAGQGTTIRARLPFEREKG